jgi:hypothetical protein
MFAALRVRGAHAEIRSLMPYAWLQVRITRDTRPDADTRGGTGATVYTSVEPSDVTAQNLGDAAVLTGIARIKVV